MYNPERKLLSTMYNANKNIGKYNVEPHTNVGMDGCTLRFRADLPLDPQHTCDFCSNKAGIILNWKQRWESLVESIPSKNEMSWYRPQLPRWLIKKKKGKTKRNIYKRQKRNNCLFECLKKGEVSSDMTTENGRKTGVDASWTTTSQWPAGIAPMRTMAADRPGCYIKLTQCTITQTRSLHIHWSVDYSIVPTSSVFVCNEPRYVRSLINTAVFISRQIPPFFLLLTYLMRSDLSAAIQRSLETRLITQKYSSAFHCANS